MTSSDHVGATSLLVGCTSADGLVSEVFAPGTKEKRISLPLNPAPVLRDWPSSTVDEVAEQWQLSERESKDFRLLVERLYDIKHPICTPEVIIRFLKAHPGHVDASERMFRKMITWRREQEVDTILNDYEPPQLLRDSIPGAILEGRDLDGDPIYLGRLGKTDAYGLIETFGGDELIKHGIWLREMIAHGTWLQTYEQESGRRFRQLTIIDELEGLTMRQLHRCVLSCYGAIFRLDQDNYPEVAKRIIILRTPSLFRALWNLSKHFFDPSVRGKMIFCSPSQTERVLERFVDLKVLPPCIVACGQGRAAEGMPSGFQGGVVPLPRKG